MPTMAVQKPKVLLLGEVFEAHDEWKALEEIAEVVTPKATTRQEFIAECKSGVLDGVVAAYRTFESVTITGRFDNELLDVLPKSLKFFSVTGAGYDGFDIDACTAHGVRVSNVIGAVDNATADVTMWLMLGALRNLPSTVTALRAGNWRGNPPPPLGQDPQGKVLGILGMGGIGRNLAAKARAFGMTIRYHNRSQLSPELEAGAEYVSFETLLKESDVLSLNLPLNPATRHTISTPQFAIMKRGVIIVNTARGAVVDEAALVTALESGRVGNVGLDVFENEPEVHPGLLANEKVLLTPHMGTYTVGAETDMERCAIGNVRAAVTTGKLINVVPEQRSLE